MKLDKVLINIHSTSMVSKLIVTSTIIFSYLEAHTLVASFKEFETRMRNTVDLDIPQLLGELIEYMVKKVLET